MSSRTLKRSEYCSYVRESQIILPKSVFGTETLCKESSISEKASFPLNSTRDLPLEHLCDHVLITDFFLCGGDNLEGK